MATFYIARSEIITPLPWLTFALPFSCCKMLGIRVQFAGTIWRLKRRFNNPFPQIFLDCVARDARAPRNLANGHLLSQRPCPDNLQKSHVDHSICPQLVQAGERLHMGQFSVTTLAAAGSILSGNQHSAVILFKTKPAFNTPACTAEPDDTITPPKSNIAGNC